MQSFGSFLVSLVVASSVVSAASIPAAANAGTFSVKAAHNSDFNQNGPLALAKTYLKHGKPLPADLANAVAPHLNKRATGEGSTSPTANDLEYLTEIQIGTPPQTLPVIFDTGSSDFWVYSNVTKEKQHQKLYLPGKSSTSKLLSGQTWAITYGDSSTSRGTVYTDVAALGALKVPNQAIEVALDVSQKFYVDPALSGILGLASSSRNMVSPDRQKTFFDNARQFLKEPLFTVDLKHQADGSFDFGYIDHSKYTGDIAYAPVGNDGTWTFNCPGFSVGRGHFSKHSFPLLVDTGSSVISLDDRIVQAYYGAVPAAHYDENVGGVVFDCKTKLPDFHFYMGSTVRTIPGSLINLGKSGPNVCFGGIQSNEGSGVNVLGDVAFKAGFVVFDVGQKRIGWAAKKI